MSMKAQEHLGTLGLYPGVPGAERAGFLSLLLLAICSLHPLYKVLKSPPHDATPPPESADAAFPGLLASTPYFW